jgi:hypothetical protein
MVPALVCVPGWLRGVVNPNLLLQLFSAGLRAPQIYAHVSREEGQLVLELTLEAIQLGLLEVCVASALLLQCGREID